jgi:hypothetical protein
MNHGDVTRLNNLGVEAHVRGAYAEAVHLLKQALTNAEEHSTLDPSLLATTLSNSRGVPLLPIGAEC